MPAPSLFTTVKLAAKACSPLLLAYRDQEAVLRSQLDGWWSALDAGAIHTTGNYSEPIALAIHEFTAATRRIFFQRGHTNMGELKDVPQCAGDFVADAVFTRYLLAAFRAGASGGDYLWGLTEMQRHLGCLSPEQSFQLDFALRVGAEYTEAVLEQRGFNQVRTKFRSALLNLFLLTADANSPLGATYTYRWLRTHLTPALLAAPNSVLPNQQLGLYDPQAGKLVFFSTADDSGVFAAGKLHAPSSVAPSGAFASLDGLAAAGPHAIAGSGPGTPATTPSVPASEYPPTGFGIPIDVAAKENCASTVPSWDRSSAHYPLSALQYILDPTHQGHGLCSYLDLLRSDGKCRLGLCGDRTMELQMLTGGKGVVADMSVGGAPAAGEKSGSTCESPVPSGVFACLDQAKAGDRKPIGDSNGDSGRIASYSNTDSSASGSGTGSGNFTPGCKDYGNAPITLGQSNGGGGEDPGATKSAKDGDDTGGGDGQDDGAGDDNRKASKDDDDTGSSAGESASNSNPENDDTPQPAGSAGNRGGGRKDPAPSDFGYYPGNGGANGTPPGGPPGAQGQLPNPGWQPGMQSPPAPSRTSPAAGPGTRAASNADPTAGSEEHLREMLSDAAATLKSMMDPDTGEIADHDPRMEELKAKVGAAAQHPIIQQRFQAGAGKAERALTLPMLQQAVQSAVGALYPGLDQPTLDLVGPVLKGLMDTSEGVVVTSKDLLGQTGWRNGGHSFRIYIANHLREALIMLELNGHLKMESDEHSITDRTYATMLKFFEREIVDTFLHEWISHGLPEYLGVDGSEEGGHRLLDVVGKILLEDEGNGKSSANAGGVFSQAIAWEIWPAVGGNKVWAGNGGKQQGGAGGNGSAPQSCDPALDQCGGCNLLTQQSLAISDCHGFNGFAGQLYGSGVDKSQFPNAGLTEPSDAVDDCIGMGQNKGGDQPCPMQQCGPGETGFYDALANSDVMGTKKNGGTGLACSCRKSDTPNPKALRNPNRESIGCKVIDCPPGTILAPGSCSCQALDRRGKSGRAF